LFQVAPPLGETCHWKLGAPLAATENIAVPPNLIIWSAGCDVNSGGVPTLAVYTYWLACQDDAMYDHSVTYRGRPSMGSPVTDAVVKTPDPVSNRSRPPEVLPMYRS
jgi:hypothetical protein